MKEGRKPEYPEKNPGDELQKMHENSSPKRDSNPHNSIGGRLGKQTCLPLRYASPRQRRHTKQNHSNQQNNYSETNKQASSYQAARQGKLENYSSPEKVMNCSFAVLRHRLTSQSVREKGEGEETDRQTKAETERDRDGESVSKHTEQITSFIT